MRFTKRFEKLDGITKTVFLPNRLHLTIFYDALQSADLIKRKVLKEIDFSGFNRSVETLSFYPEELQEKDAKG